MRIATGCIGHETNTFSSVPTRLDDFVLIVSGCVISEGTHACKDRNPGNRSPTNDVLDQIFHIDFLLFPAYSRRRSA